MSDTIKTEPTPIQRNDKDVAMELTKLYAENFGCENADELAEIYLKFYATSAGASAKGYSLISLMPEVLRKAYEQR
jgi:hypothetical protein